MTPRSLFNIILKIFGIFSMRSGLGNRMEVRKRGGSKSTNNWNYYFQTLT